MNPAWRMYKGSLKGAEQPGFNDKEWNLVSLPDGIEYVPTEASGCVNYQGEVWYRKHFTPEASWKGKQLFLHFEAIMGNPRYGLTGHWSTNTSEGSCLSLLISPNTSSMEKIM